MQPFSFPDGVEQSVCLLRDVNAKARQKIGHPANARSGRHEAEEEIPIHGKVKRGIKPSDFFVKRPSPKKSLLRHIVEKADGVLVVARQDPSTHLLTGFVNDHTVSVDDIDISMPCEIVSHEGQGSWHQYVVRVKVGHDVSVECGKTFNDRMGLAIIRLADAIGELRLIPRQDVPGVIERSAVDDRIFELRVILVDNTFDGGNQGLTSIEIGRDDRDRWQVPCSAPATGKCFSLQRPWRVLAENSKLLTMET